MKAIVKNTEPQALLDWKDEDKMFKRGKPNWDRVSGPIKADIRASLLSEQGYICCYCESSIDIGDCHVEHLKPQGQFPLEQLDYDNLLCSCQLSLNKGEPRHCGNAKGSWYDRLLFVSPLDPNCESHFEFTLDGHIKATEGDLGSIATIQHLALNSDKLQALRAAAIEPFIMDDISQEEMAIFVKHYLTKDEQRFNAFYNTIKGLSHELIEMASY